MDKEWFIHSVETADPDHRDIMLNGFEQLVLKLNLSDNAKYVKVIEKDESYIKFVLAYEREVAATLMDKLTKQFKVIPFVLQLGDSSYMVTIIRTPVDELSGTITLSLNYINMG